MTFNSRNNVFNEKTNANGKLLGFWSDISCSLYDVMMELHVMSVHERHGLLDVHGPRVSTTTCGETGDEELRDALKAQAPSLDFRAAALTYTGTAITVTWPIDNGRSTVTRTFYPHFTPVDREEYYRVAYKVFSQRLGASEWRV